MIGTIKTYTLADMAQTAPPHVNSWNAKLYDLNGLEIALQGNFDGQGNRTQGSSHHHDHHYDELVYLLEGDYGRYNRENVDQLGPNFLRIRAGVKHGGDANGVWISAKPKDFMSPSLDTGKRTINYNGRLSGLRVYWTIYPEIINLGLVGVEVSIEQSSRIVNVRISNASLSRNIMSFEFSQ